MHNHRLVSAVPMKDHQHERHSSGQIDDSLCNLIKHQHRSVPIFLVNDLEARGIVEHSLDSCECVEDLRNTKRLWVFERVLCSEALSLQALLHVGWGEEREIRVHRVLHFYLSVLANPNEPETFYPGEVARKVTE